MKEPVVSIVFPTMNRKEMLLECLDSLYKQDYPKDKIDIIIADNGSTDDSVSVIKKKFPKVKIIQNKHNLGSPLAINQCILKTKGDYIFRLDFCDLTTSQILGTKDMPKMTITDPLQCYDLRFKLDGIPVHHPGRYSFDLSANGDFVELKTIGIHPQKKEVS